MPNLFRLATFNLENLDYSATRRALFERRLGVLKPLLSELAADILCLQEINAQKAADHDGRRFLALDRLLAGGPYESYRRATSVRPGTSAPADVHNLVIASRWPIVERRQLFHDIVAKSLGSSNPYNMVKAAMAAFQKMESPRTVAGRRSLKVNDVLGRKGDIKETE